MSTRFNSIFAILIEETKAVKITLLLPPYDPTFLAGAEIKKFSNYFLKNPSARNFSRPIELQREFWRLVQEEVTALQSYGGWTFDSLNMLKSWLELIRNMCAQTSSNQDLVSYVIELT
jgi:hypothetical protein